MPTIQMGDRRIYRGLSTKMVPHVALCRKSEPRIQNLTLGLLPLLVSLRLLLLGRGCCLCCRLLDLPRRLCRLFPLSAGKLGGAVTLEVVVWLLANLLPVILNVVVGLPLSAGLLGILGLLLPPCLGLGRGRLLPALGSLGRRLGLLKLVLALHILLLLTAPLLLELLLLPLSPPELLYLSTGLLDVLVEDDLAVPQPFLHLDDLQLHAGTHLVQLDPALP
mmetsp:Transcript_8071/g.23133  ORF Transcript_8071/g.23133 Transcript_8071/m.23133 type:complete len:221 (-) Transcript_8071:939-1601(-)